MFKLLSKAYSALSATQGIEVKGQSRQPNGLEDDHSHDNNVRIGLGPRITKYFRIYLMKLPESTFLRPFMPEHGSDSEKLLYGIFFI